MPIPFLVPAGMIAVKVAGKWVLKKIAKRLARRTRLKPKTEKALKKKSTKQGRKVQKKKTQDPVYSKREKHYRKNMNRTRDSFDPVNKKLTKTLIKDRDRQTFKTLADKKHEDVKRMHTDKKYRDEVMSNEIANMTSGGKRGEYLPTTYRDRARRDVKELTNEIKKEKEQLKKSIQKRKRTRELTEDAKRRRN
jgi:hypothetical protein